MSLTQRVLSPEHTVRRPISTISPVVTSREIASEFGGQITQSVLPAPYILRRTLGSFDTPTPMTELGSSVPSLTRRQVEDIARGIVEDDNVRDDETYSQGGTGGGSSTVIVNEFLPEPDMFDLDSIYFYFGYEDVNGGWLVRRQNRATVQTDSATTGFDTLADAFPNRATLDYI